MAELDGCRVTAVLSADSEFDVGTGLLSEFDSGLHKTAYTDLIEVRERIELIDVLAVVVIEELAGVIT